MYNYTLCYYKPRYEDAVSPLQLQLTPTTRVEPIKWTNRREYLLARQKHFRPMAEKVLVRHVNFVDIKGKVVNFCINHNTVYLAIENRLGQHRFPNPKTGDIFK